MSSTPWQEMINQIKAKSPEALEEFRQHERERLKKLYHEQQAVKTNCPICLNKFQQVGLLNIKRVVHASPLVLAQSQEELQRKMKRGGNIKRNMQNNGGNERSKKNMMSNQIFDTVKRHI